MGEEGGAGGEGLELGVELVEEEGGGRGTE